MYQYAIYFQRSVIQHWLVSGFRNKSQTHVPVENELDMPYMTDETKVYNPWADNAPTPGVTYAEI